MTKVPKHIRDAFGSAHAFRAQARRLARELDVTLNNLRGGCAFFPGSGIEDVHVIDKHITKLRKKLTVKNWGR